jgi:hypothetical protein
MLLSGMPPQTPQRTLCWIAITAARIRRSCRCANSRVGAGNKIFAEFCSRFLNRGFAVGATRPWSMYHEAPS